MPKIAKRMFGPQSIADFIRKFFWLWWYTMPKISEMEGNAQHCS